MDLSGYVNVIGIWISGTLISGQNRGRIDEDLPGCDFKGYLRRIGADFILIGRENYIRNKLNSSFGRGGGIVKI